MSLAVTPAYADSASHWVDFLEWLRSTNSAGDPDSLLNGWRANLRAGKVPVLEIERRLEAVTHRMNSDTDGWRWMFNRVYAGAAFAGMYPNAFMTRVTERLAPGCALDICFGQGRNSLHLAVRGWEVCGFDVSEQGLKVAAANARDMRIKLRMVMAAEQAFPYGRNRWDLILIAYAPIAVTDPCFVSKIRRSLRRGGAVVIESFSYDTRFGRTRPGALEIDSSELVKAFGGFSIIEHEETMALPDWGTSQCRVVRLFAQAL